MQKFIQLHILTSYPAANLNRDDMGRPKTVVMGQTERLRISSQSLKRAWRTSPVFNDSLAGRVGVRTKEMGENIFHALTLGLPLREVMHKDFSRDTARGNLPTVKEKTAIAAARAIAGQFAKIKPEYKPKKKEDYRHEEMLESLHTEQMAHFSQAEIDNVAALVEQVRESDAAPEDKDLNLLRKERCDVDIAMFGRMLAAAKRFNIDAAVQVAHAMTVHKAAVEDDFFTAVDDLNKEDTGAGHMGFSEFGAGLFYLYLCVDTQLLLENLDGDTELAAKALEVLCKAACTVSPSGKQNSFASRSFASYCLAERGDEQPRNLSVAFLDGVRTHDGFAAEDMLKETVNNLHAMRTKIGQVYGILPETREFNVASGEGSLQDVCAFITE